MKFSEHPILLIEILITHMDVRVDPRKTIKIEQTHENGDDRGMY